ncbi:MAG: Eco57I restriction-modification methylase domain-containing protein [candidate division Zixibacteria bacterium]|nr:Eco57I restriction-modification methylase domain-containing protein [candidate division Zixibacteria bacterium]
MLVGLEPASFAKPLESQEIFPEFRRYINSYDRFGKYKDVEGNKIDILIVNLNADRSIERARSAQRNFVAKYLKSGQPKDAALVAFVSPGDQDWRFSFVRMAYKYDADRNKVVEELSPAKRYSFLVGANENSHTAQSRLLPILANGEPKLTDLENAFAVDPVTKEFFKQYRNLFDKLSASLNKNKGFVIVATRNNLDIENFAKKLLGQIVFLYFLQKKGWLGVPKGKTWGDGDRGFLRTLFSRCVEKNENFYNDYLEILFYDTLNNPRSRQADRNYSQHFESKIPFLNGGLFEPDYDWERTTIHLENGIFGDILEVFDRFNFTVKEDEPLEREVAVDPEMLGKVFENLLAENLRKGHGTYYTPREIVHYMCQESLISYLVDGSALEYETIRGFIRNPVLSVDELAPDIRDNRERIDKLLAEIRVLDPACGSGAFLVGMLQEIVRARQSLRPRLTDYRMKKTAIQDCIYGVDIDPGAVDIAKLRLWLSLVVDYDLEDIEPLPNLDYKIMQGNSLLEQFEGVRFYEGLNGDGHETLFDDKDQVQKKDQLRWQKREYFSTSDDKSKATLRSRINDLIDWFVRRAVNEELQRVKTLRKAKERERELLKKGDREKHWEQWAGKLAKEGALNDLLKTIHDPKGVRPFFLWKLNFMEVFDEKDGFDIVIANPPYVNSHEMKELLTLYRSVYPIAHGSFDIYILFFKRALDLMKQNGTLCFITSNKYVIADYGSKLRDLLKTDTTILKLIDLADCRKVFENVLVSPIVTVVQKSLPMPEHCVKIALLGEDDLAILDRIKFTEVQQDSLTRGKSNAFEIHISDDVAPVLSRLLMGCEELVELADVRTGIMGFEYWAMSKFIREGERPGYIRIVTNSHVEPYNFLFGKPINLFKKKFTNPYLDVDSVPLSQETKKLFGCEKIIVRGVAKKLTASIDREGFGILVAVHAVRPYPKKNISIEYLTAVLNSSLVNWFHRKKFYSARIPKGSLKYPISFLKSVPIKKPQQADHDKVTQMVRDLQHLILKSRCSESAEIPEVAALRKQIDTQIFAIYGIKPEELKTDASL